MKTTMTALAALTLAMGLTACSESDADTAREAGMAASLEGTWKLDPTSAQFENADSSYLFTDGEYTCNSCLPPYSVAANGEWQAVDRPGVDGLKISMVDDMTITSASRFEDEELGKSTWTVSEDGQTMTINWTDMAGEEVTEGSTILERVAAGPDGSHAASGEWRTKEVGSMSDAALTVSYDVDGDTVTFNGNGGSYTATLGGEAVAMEGDNSGGMIRIEKTGANSYRETYMRDGETTSIVDLTIEGDTVRAVSNDPRDGSKVSWTATRQS